MGQQTVSEFGLRAERVSGTACMPEAHRHAEVEVNFIVSGKLSYWLGGGLVTLESGSLCAFWAAYPQRVVADSEDLEYYRLTVPLAAVLSWGFPQSLVDALMTGALVRQSQVPLIAAEQLLWDNWLAGCTAPADEFHREVLEWEVRARLGRFALEAAVPAALEDPSRSAGISRSVEKMVRFIGRNFSEPIKVADIAAHAGLNPNYATEAFHKVLGLGIKDFLNRQRIADARRLLLASSLTVPEICQRTGFSSPSRFYDWFQRLCGSSPEQYRRAVPQISAEQSGQCVRVPGQ